MNALTLPNLSQRTNAIPRKAFRWQRLRASTSSRNRGSHNTLGTVSYCTPSRGSHNTRLRRSSSSSDSTFGCDAIPLGWRLVLTYTTVKLILGWGTASNGSLGPRKQTNTERFTYPKALRLYETSKIQCTVAGTREWNTQHISCRHREIRSRRLPYRQWFALEHATPPQRAWR